MKHGSTFLQTHLVSTVCIHSFPLVEIITISIKSYNLYVYRIVHTTHTLFGGLINHYILLTTWCSHLSVWNYTSAQKNIHIFQWYLFNKVQGVYSTQAINVTVLMVSDILVLLEPSSKSDTIQNSCIYSQCIVNTLYFVVYINYKYVYFPELTYESEENGGYII